MRIKKLAVVEALKVAKDAQKRGIRIRGEGKGVWPRPYEPIGVTPTPIGLPNLEKKWGLPSGTTRTLLNVAALDDYTIKLTAKDSSNPDYSLLHFSYQKKGKEHASINIHLFKYSDTVRSVAGAVNAWTRYTGLSVETRAARLEHVKKLNAKEKDIVKAFKKLGFDPKGPRYSGKY